MSVLRDIDAWDAGPWLGILCVLGALGFFALLFVDRLGPPQPCAEWAADGPQDVEHTGQVFQERYDLCVRERGMQTGGAP